MKICKNFEKMCGNFQLTLIMQKVSLIITKIGNYAKKYYEQHEKLFLINHWETFIVRLDLFKGVLIALHM